jgi:amino acid transporter
VVAPHGFSFIFIQACVAILILVGFESVTSMGEEAKNAKRDVPRAVLLSLGIQGIACYMVEYFAANYFLNKGYTLTNAAASGAPLGDMMVIVGTWLFGSYKAGRAFMLVQAFTVFLALIGTTLSCMSTGARVTYAMGRDEEVPAHFGLVHGKMLTPHRSIWTLAIVSAVIGILTVSVYLGGTTPTALDPKYHNMWYALGIFDPGTISKLPNTLVIVTLISNFGTFLLYMLTCIIAIVAFREHQTFHGFKHVVVPVFGLIANLACMLFYLFGPFLVTGMSVKEPYIALGICAAWGIYGGIYFLRASKKASKPVLLTERPAAT